MPGILVVERSTTLSHLLRRTLTAAGLAPRSELPSYFEAIDHLRRSAELEQPYGVLLVGAPARLTREFTALLDFLRSPDGSMLPVVLMTHEMLPELEEFARARGNLSLVLWANFSRIPGVLRGLLPEDGDSVPAAIPAVPAPSTNIHILFVDDSHSVRLAYQHLLERNGFQVSTAGSIGEADEMAAQMKYDLVIVDYYLPDGNGDELCRRLSAKAEPPGLAIITGTYREDVIKRCLEAGATECMFKNEAKELFLARVRTLSRQIQMQKSVEKERRRLDGILGSVGDGVYGVDGSGTITFINPTALRLLGYRDEAAAVGKNAHSAIHFAAADGQAIAEEASPLSRAYARGESINGLETVFWKQNGDGMPVECKVFFITPITM